MWKKIKSEQERKNTFRIKKELWIPVFVLMIGLVVLVNIGIRADSSQRDLIRSKAELNAVTYADHMNADIVRGIDITNTFEQIVISENGKISMFSKVSENMMADYIQSIQIAPDGVVTEIYPEAGNEAGKIDLIYDKERGKINDILDMSKIEAGKTVFKYNDFSILNFIQEINNLFHSQIDEKNRLLQQQRKISDMSR